MSLSPDKHYRARIHERRVISEDLFVLRVDPGGPFNFLAGQYATLGVEIDGKRIERAYSIASSPYESELEFFIERVPEGELTPPLHKMMKGQTLLCRKFAKGRFTLDLRSGRKHHLLLATVTGIAPFVSYVRTLHRDWKEGTTAMPGDHKVYCLQGASRSEEFGYRGELERTAAEAPWLEYVPTVSRPWEDASWKGKTGRVEDLIRKYIHVWDLKPETTSVYLCGNPSMVENARGILMRAGWKKEAMLEEMYYLPQKKAAAE